MVQAAPPVELLPGGRLTLTLREPDFDTARRLASAVNGEEGLWIGFKIDQANVSGSDTPCETAPGGRITRRPLRAHRSGFRWSASARPHPRARRTAGSSA